MKKITLCLMLVVVFFLSGCDSKKLNTYQEISYQEYTDMMDRDESFPLVIGSSTCSACSMFKGTMESFIKKYQIVVYYIDISKLSEDDLNLLKSEVNFSSTPTTIFVENGKHTSVYYRIVGADAMSGVVSAYTRMGYIKGE